MAKYDPLERKLASIHPQPADLTFFQIEQIIDDDLPRSAATYREWWANDAHHVQANAWMGAGYQVDTVDLGRSKVRFIPRR